jgi:hypothetical protein
MGDEGNLRFDAQSLTTTIHDQSISWWAQFNFGDPALAPWPVYPVEPGEDLKAKVDVEEKAFETVDNAERLGFDVDRQQFLEEHKIGWAKPGERSKPIEPTTLPGTQPADPAAPTPGNEQTPTGEPGAKQSGGATQARVLEARALTAGAQNGQDYADRVIENTTAHGAKGIAPTVAAMIAAVEQAGSYEEARAAILKRYSKAPAPKELAAITEAALIMVNLGGRLAVREDVPELDENERP